MNIATQHLLPIGLLRAMSAACAPEIREVQNYRATFVCDGNQPMQVHFTPFKALLESQGVSVAMTQQPATTGFRYTGGGQSLRQRGHEATWTDAKRAVHHCRDTAAASPRDANPIHTPHRE